MLFLKEETEHQIPRLQEAEKEAEDLFEEDEACTYNSNTS